MGHFLSREQILAASDIDYDVVSVPEWGGDIRIKALRGTQVDHYQQSRIKTDGRFDVKKAKAQLVYMSAVDADGNRLFQSEKDVEKLAEKNNRALERCAAAITKLSGLKTQEIESTEPTEQDGKTADVE